MSNAPFYVYIIGLIVALPVFFLLGTGLVMLVRSIIFWVMNENPQVVPQPKTRK